MQVSCGTPQKQGKCSEGNNNTVGQDIPMYSEPHRPTKITLGLLVVASSLACIVLPTIGASNYFAEFKQPYSARMHFEILGEQLAGPVFTFLLSSALVALVILRKRLGWWMWLAALIGPIYTARAVGGLSHDFSHTVFRECSGIYGTWISGLCILGGASMAALALLTRCFRRRIHLPEIQAESGPV